MKLFAFYLPQFHEIPENNKWWGNGFTEWTHVKHAKPLYKNHKQPLIPYEKNFYNLLDKDTVLWQTELLNKFQLSGFVYYHYYYKGKTLLEKPAENLLKWKDINQKFFFCWANHSWYKSQGSSKQLLIKQDYGSARDWNDHFEYLKIFFQDSRYEKINNKPVLMVFSSFFNEKNDMLNLFNQRCKEMGFDGIYIIFSCGNKREYLMSQKLKEGTYSYKWVLREPDFSKSNICDTRKYKIYDKILSLHRSHNYVYKINGNDLFKYKIRNDYKFKDYLKTIFFEWDNTPRHGYNGYIITPPMKDFVMNYLNKYSNEDYMFINAWNEWAEGMVLEPTLKNGFKYLNWIKEWTEQCE